MANPQDFDAALARADGLLRSRNAPAVIAICEDLLRVAPAAVAPRLMIARAEQMRHRPDLMLDQVAVVLKADPTQFDARLIRIEARVAQSDIAQAHAEIREILQTADLTSTQLGRIAEIQTQLADHEGALESLLCGLALSPRQDRQRLSLLYNLSSAYIALGEMEKAEQALDDLIHVNPSDFDAYYNRATLRTQTPERNHIEALESQLKRPNLPPMGEVQLAYALAKEREDLGDYQRSFAALARGAKRRRANMAYAVDGDLETMSLLQRVFNGDFASTDFNGCDDARPVFIVGLPRSGTTLVDRIITSHPDAESVGEINDLPLAITRLSGSVRTKEELVRNSSRLDMRELGETYLKGLDGRGAMSRRVVDKTPLNFLYIGLIAKALPAARIIHVTRNPMDVGYAMFKTLFRMGYPFSYDQGDLAQYITAKMRLMSHWHEMFPGRVHDVAYEALIKDQEGVSRDLIAAIGLDWDPACLKFHTNRSASSTASAAQVRRPLYTSSVEKWRHYEAELAPLAAGLTLGDAL
ncbi:MAG: tetratricopeptide repeat-containing sulfotransferase family protein [Litorimonas sp.]